jgi:hypothetical protein
MKILFGVKHVTSSCSQYHEIFNFEEEGKVSGACGELHNKKFDTLKESWTLHKKWHENKCII